ncbi:MAG: metal-dependent transcriptional regulator [Clostridia bacterium]|jgi:DtxR family Mn-dependent transcriptional regulator|nr:metal-dependent transcriptional regulator [Clostridia bacterium]
MRTHESEEMYLETILLLKQRKANVRSVDVVEELGYAKSSVSRAVNLLVKKGFIAIDGAGDISLTAVGQKKADDIYDRHRVITEVLMNLGADRALAEANACRIEHVISDDMFDILKKSIQ